MDALITDIQKFSLHDGPGIRTTVFLKGCNLRCFWCHNPEALESCIEIQFFSQKCAKCGECVSACPSNSQLMDNGQRIYLRESCVNCGKCVICCPTGSLAFSARRMSVDDIFDEIMEDQAFFENSGGGVTFSGGEPLLQNEFLMEILKECKKNGIHTALETAGNVPYSLLQRVLPFTDLIIHDLKMFNDQKHIQGTGVSNKFILENLKRLSADDVPIWIRIPVVEGYNDNTEDLSRIAEFICSLKRVDAVELLPYHKLGQAKYDSLGKEYKASELNVPDINRMGDFVKIFKTCRLTVLNEP